MIAVLVLSIGILGMATLQLQALKSNQSALTRTEATQFGYMITDMMRANRSAACSANTMSGWERSSPAARWRYRMCSTGNRR